MSDDTAAAPDAAKPAAKAGPAPMLLIAAIAGGLLAGAGVGLFVVGPMVAKPKPATADAGAGAHGDKEGKGGKDEHGKKGGHGEKTAIYRIENLIVNPAGSNGQRFLMASVALQFEDPKQEEEARGHEVELRDAVISTLESQSLESLARLGARDSLRGQLLQRLQPILGEHAAFRVFLPQYVIQ